MMMPLLSNHLITLTAFHNVLKISLLEIALLTLVWACQLVLFAQETIMHAFVMCTFKTLPSITHIKQFI